MDRRAAAHPRHCRGPGHGVGWHGQRPRLRRPGPHVQTAQSRRRRRHGIRLNGPSEVSLTEALAFAGRFVPVAWKRRWVALISTAVIIGVASLAGVFGPVWIVAIAASVILLASLHGLALSMVREAGVETRTGVAASVRALACILLLGVLLAIVGALLLVLLLALAFGVASAGAHFDAADPRTWA